MAVIDRYWLDLQEDTQFVVKEIEEALISELVEEIFSIELCQAFFVHTLWFIFVGILESNFQIDASWLQQAYLTHIFDNNFNFEF